MAVRGSIQIPRVIKAMQSAFEGSFQKVGDRGVAWLKDNEKESDTTGRLRDSFSWTDSKGNTSGGGSQALTTDIVDKPTEPLSINIGTLTPYAVAVDMGTTDNFQYGKNGAPSNFADLKKAIKEWLEIKIMKGKFTLADDVNIWAVADGIAKRIVETGTDAHPFWQKSIDSIKMTAVKDVVKAMSERLGSIPVADNYIGGKQ